MLQKNSQVKYNKNNHRISKYPKLLDPNSTDSPTTFYHYLTGTIYEKNTDNELVKVDTVLQLSSTILFDKIDYNNENSLWKVKVNLVLNNSTTYNFETSKFPLDQCDNTFGTFIHSGIDQTDSTDKINGITFYYTIMSTEQNVTISYLSVDRSDSWTFVGNWFE